MEATLVYGIAFDEVLFQYAVSPFLKAISFRLFSIPHRNNHIKIIVIYFLYLGISLFSTIFLGYRNFCAYRLIFLLITFRQQRYCHGVLFCSYYHKFYQNYRFLIGFQQEMAFVLLLPMMFLYSMRQDSF